MWLQIWWTQRYVSKVNWNILKCNHIFIADWPIEIPLFELVPSSSQVVFEGDSLPLRCRVSGLVDEPTKVVWLRKGQEVKSNQVQGLEVRTQLTHDGAIIIHDLQITKYVDG